MKHMPPITSVMTPFPYSIGVDRTISEAQAMMAKHQVHHLPVMEQNQLVGVIAENNIRLSRGGNPGPEQTRVRDVCDMGAYTVELTTPLDQVLLHMAKNHIGLALVMKQGRLAGIFTITDACRSYAKLLQTVYAKGNGNDAA